MSGLQEIKKKYNKTLISDGEKVLTYGAMTSEKIKEQNNYINGLINRFENDFNNLNLSELEELRLHYGIKTDKVNLIYQEGFVMFSNDVKRILDSMPLMVQGAISMMGRTINKDGCMKYNNDKPIQNIKGLMEYLKISKTSWNTISEYNEKYSIIKKVKMNGIWYMVLNPLFCSVGYEITSLKLYMFGKYLKDNNYITKLDYAYLCKKHGIIPE